MTTEEKVIKNKLGLIKLSKTLSNVSQAYKVMGYDNLSERRKLLLTMIDAVYFEAKKTRSVVAIKPKPPFRPVFQVAASKAGSNIRIINEPYKSSPVFLVETGESRTLPETFMAVGNRHHEA